MAKLLHEKCLGRDCMNSTETRHFLKSKLTRQLDAFHTCDAKLSGKTTLCLKPSHNAV